MSTWLTYQEVADRLEGTADPADERLIGAVDGVTALVEKRHPEWDWPNTPPPDNWHEGALQWAALMYQQRNAPSGFPGFGDVGDGFAVPGFGDAQKWSEIMRLLEWRKPVIS